MFKTYLIFIKYNTLSLSQADFHNHTRMMCVLHLTFSPHSYFSGRQSGTLFKIDWSILVVLTYFSHTLSETYNLQTIKHSFNQKFSLTPFPL